MRKDWGDDSSSIDFSSVIPSISTSRGNMGRLIFLKPNPASLGLVSPGVSSSIISVAMGVCAAL